MREWTLQCKLVVAMTARSDLDALLDRMRLRWYPETIPVLASSWLKTLCAAGHDRGYWKQLLGFVKIALRDQQQDAAAVEVLASIRDWIVQSRVLEGESHGGPRATLQPVRDPLDSHRLSSYMARLLNEWLPLELASLLVESSDFDLTEGGGTPVLARGRALERLLLRERFSVGMLEELLNHAALSPKQVYPADLEMLRDVLLQLLGRTAAAPLPIMPPALLALAEDSHLPSDFPDRIQQAVCVSNEGRQEIRVPITAAEAAGILAAAPMRIGCVVLTLDGRWWESETLESGEQHNIVFEPRGRLRVDDSAEHAKIVVPWPEAHLRWSGSFEFPATFELFGREWHRSRWETDGARDWLELEFSRILPAAEIQPQQEDGLRRSHPASIDIAWAALGNALTSALAEKSSEPVEQLRRSEFIPLGRALLGLAELLNKPWPKSGAIENQVRSVQYMEAEISLNYGLMPWRILPPQMQGKLLKKRSDQKFFALLNQVFDAMPGRDGEVPPSRAA